MSDESLDVSVSTLVSCYLENEKDLELDRDEFILIDDFTVEGGGSISLQSEGAGMMWIVKDVEYTKHQD